MKNDWLLIAGIAGLGYLLTQKLGSRSSTSSSAGSGSTSANVLNQPPLYTVLGNQGDVSKTFYSNPANFVDTGTVSQPYNTPVNKSQAAQIDKTAYKPVGTIELSTGRVESHGVQLPQAYHPLAIVNGKQRGGHYT